ncbi:MAG TPA: glutamate-1-semialdehyde 2,1-aminomutase, partial [Planctomycetota bacterium]|nr:glutamate-1-semialdehyde 2,1-aminomutase [Planctomycetota bacterium]
MPFSSQKSQKAFQRASAIIPGGVNSPVRAFQSVGGTPRFIARAQGCRMVDLDGHTLIDYIGSWGPMIVGHAHPAVQRALAAQIKKGTSYGAPTENEARLAEAVRRRIPSCEMLRLVSSGTEATMHAIRLARGYTGRAKVLKFIGHYHGAHDAMLVKPGSGVLTLGLPGTPGVPDAVAGLTVAIPFNNVPALKAAFKKHGRDLAAAIVEPVPGNVGVIPLTREFVVALRALCKSSGALLIFDEVMSGFRVSSGGAQNLMGIKPDLTTLGKIIGGGLPVGAYGGAKKIMRKVAPAGPVYQAGTLSGNPLATAAGLATLELLDAAAYRKLEKISATLCAGLADAAAHAGVPCCINRVGSMWTVFFTEGPVNTFDDAMKSDTKRYGKFFHAMLDRGVYLP